MILHLVWDTSGSMVELGKHMIARGVARATEQYMRLGHGYADLKLVVWGTESRILDWRPEQEFPSEMLVSKGATNAEALVALLGKRPAEKLLLITDGFWSEAEVKVLRRWKESLEPNTLRFIKIGADSNPQFRGEDVFAAEDLFAALDGWLQGGVV